MNFSISALFAGFVYGVLGVYLIKRARSEAHIPHFVIGLVLLVYPYIVENIYLLWGIGAGLLCVAYWVA